MFKVFDFLREVRVELAKVVWPTRAQTIQLTIIVIFVTILVTFFVGIVDFLLAQLFKVILKVG